MKNVMAIFESRINDIFSRATTSSAPLQFKKLAKRTIREMENETFVIDGVDTAPALYTILVSAADDQVMRPLYVDITEEVSSLVEAQAKKRGYSFVGKPLVRFMIDPSLKQGKYAVFAENIDPRTLARLRDEENAFLGIKQGGSFDEADDVDDDAGLTRMPDMEPQDLAPEPEPAPAPEQRPGRWAEVSRKMPQEPAPSAPQADQDEAEHTPEPVAEAAPEEVAASDSEPTPPAESAPEAPARQEDVPEDAEAQPEDVPAKDETDDTGEISTRVPRHAAVPKAHPTCSLTDQETGRVYTISEDHTPIGRERVEGSIVLRDPNVSRRHAELTYDGHEWHVTDLHSTNGTLVNGIDIDECSLRDGDVLTIGLLNFVFREN